MRELATLPLEWHRVLTVTVRGAQLGPLCILFIILAGLLLNVLSFGLWGIDRPGREFGWLHFADYYFTLLVFYPLALGLILVAHLGAIMALLTKSRP